MRAKQATRAGTALEGYLPSIAPPRDKNFFEGEGDGYRFFESEQRQEEDEVYEASIVAAILIINNWKPLRS